MNPIARTYRRAVAGLKAATLRWSRSGVGSWWGARLGRTTVNYASAVGDGSGNAAVVACVDAICRAFLEAPMRVRRYRRGGALEPEPKHPLLALVRRPNPYYAGRTLISATLADRTISGNAYWWKARAAAGNVVQLWWLPSTMIEPIGGESTASWITGYTYTVDGRQQTLPAADVVHFRRKLDPLNPLKGEPALRSLYREIFTDDEAANYTASLLRNMGVPGLLARPKTPEDMITPDQAAELKADLDAKTTADNRGASLVAQIPLEIDIFGFNPEQMQLETLRRVPEERIAAVLGVPAIVAGLGAGLDRSTYSNYAEAREAFFESHLIPLGMDLAEELMLQLMPDFDDPAKVELDFDVSDIRVLQEDTNALTTRLTEQLKAGAITIDEFRQELGYGTLGEAMVDNLPEGMSADDAAKLGKVLLLPSTHTPTAPADLLAPPEPEPEPEPPSMIPAELNGNGHAAPALIGAREG